MSDQPRCRYPDPDKFPETCGHYYEEDGKMKCRRDGMLCEVFSEGGSDDAGDEEKAPER